MPERSLKLAGPRRTLAIAVVILGLAAALSLLPRGSGAQASLSLEPLVQKGDKLAAGGAEARFGTSAALSADGSTLLVGAPQANGSQGAAWIFQRSGAVWVAQGELNSPAAVQDPEVEECAEESPEEAGECAFGAGVALSADGNTALVGEPSPTSTAGSAWIFKRSGPGAPWVREAEPLRAGDGAHEGRFGRSVALSADGELALVGDPSGVNGRGAVWVFTHGASWTQQSRIVDEGASPSAHLGRSVGLSADGSTVIAGGPGDAKGTGAAWTFTRSGTSWTQRGKLTGAGESLEGHFGRAVALSGDGTTALVGAQGDGADAGAVWTFSRSGSVFAESPEALLRAPAESQEHFGASLALSGDGSEALVGAPRFDSGLGIVNVFERSGATWAERPALGGSGAVGKGYSGSAVALSYDGQVAAIGASRDNRRVGAAWVFSSEPASAVPSPTVTGIEPGHGPTAGGTGVTIHGTNFTQNPSHEPVVMFGSAPATGVVVRTAAEVQAVSPPGANGTVHVTVATATGNSVATDADRFRYEGPALRVSGSGGQPGSIADGSTGVLASTVTAPGPCRVSLRSKHLHVALRTRAAVRLLRTGTGSCRGTVKLRYRRHTHGRHFKLLGIGSAHFAISPGRSQVVRIKLNELGRTLLLAGHGKLRASIAVLRTTPSPKLAKTASVRLSAKKAT
ncbi:MAG: IPT/TIG domain-containing protein [Solirubrobacteraceae bacterium]